MSDFEIGRLKRDLSELSEKLESTKNEKIEQAQKFFEILSHSDLMIIRDQLNDMHKQPTERMTLIDKTLSDYLEDKITLIEAKNILAGNEIEERPQNKIDKIFNEFGQYHLWAKKEKIRQFFTRIKFSEEDISLLSEFPDNADHPRIVEILFNFGEYFDGVSDLAQVEQNLYPNRYTEVEKQVRYRNDVAEILNKPRVETITEIKSQPKVSKVENQTVESTQGFVKVRWVGRGANGSFSIQTTEGRQVVFREKVYKVTEQTYQNLTKHRPGVKLSWQRV